MEGNGRLSGFTYAQCTAYFAPSAIHRFKVSTCAAFSVFPDFTGGIRSSGSLAVTRAIISLLSGAPATIGTAPDLAGFKASARISNLSFALRAPSSGPWHLKQFSVRIGRTSRLKSTGGTPPLWSALKTVEMPAIVTRPNTTEFTGIALHARPLCALPELFRRIALCQSLAAFRATRSLQ